MTITHPPDDHVLSEFIMELVFGVMRGTDPDDPRVDQFIQSRASDHLEIVEHGQKARELKRALAVRK